jgi:hypothetical protein
MAEQTMAVEPEVNQDMPDAEVLKCLDQYCFGLVKVLATGERVRQMVGRLLIEVRKRKLFEAKGFKSFNEFLLKEVEEKHGMSRASAYGAISVVEALPDLSLDQAERVGSARLALVARCVKHEEGGPAEKKRLEFKLLNRAEKMSLVKFRSSLEKDGLIVHSGGADKPQVIVIRAGKQLMAAWRKLVGEEDPADVLWKLLRGVRIKQRVKKAA